MKMRLRWPAAKHNADSETDSGSIPSTNDGIVNGQSALGGPDAPPSAPGAPEADLPDTQKEGKLGLLRRTKALVRFRLPSPTLNPNQRTVTISLDKDAIRVVVFRGKRVLRWGSTGLSGPSHESPNESEGPSTLEEDRASSLLQSVLDDLGIKHSGRLREFLNKVGIRRGRVVMDLSLYTTLMRHLQIPRVRTRYLEPVVVSEVLESLPFSKDEVDITWRLQKDNEGRSVHAIALPKQRVDAQVRLIKGAGLTPAAAYSKASALALSSGVAHGIVVHLEGSETALVLVSGGEPQVVHQLEFGSSQPEGDASDGPAEEHAGALLRAIEQVAGYYQPPLLTPPYQGGDGRGGASGGGRLLPVILTGQTSRTNPVIRSLTGKLRRQVLTIKPPLRYPEDFPLSEYATNLGLFLADRVGSITSASGEAELSGLASGGRPLNLLPRRHLPRPVPVFPAAIFIILILLAAVHPFNITKQIDAQVQEKDAIARELQSLRRQERAYDVILANYREDNAELESANDQMLKLEARLAELEKETGTLLTRLSIITDEALPPGVELSGVAPLGTDFTVVGTAGSHAAALQYVSNLRRVPFFEEVRLLRVDGTGGANPDVPSRVSFNLKVFVPVEEDSEEAQSE